MHQQKKNLSIGHVCNVLRLHRFSAGRLKTWLLWTTSQSTCSATSIASGLPLSDIAKFPCSAVHLVRLFFPRYFNDNDADKAAQQMDKRFYGSRLIAVEYSPVTDFREARCRAFHETRCARGGLCNFMHIKHIPKAVKRNIVRQMYEAHPDYAGARAALAGAPAKKRKVHHGPIKRQTMEERRTMIAEWNKAQL
ncbi:unnamed protein product [Effrenium voratum]|nr:unnamed protein product [Effrenium voratum]